MMCDQHDHVPAVVRVQGETDSFGSEMVDMCNYCYAQFNVSTTQDVVGKCDLCHEPDRDLKHHRDPEQSATGPVYMACQDCIAKAQVQLLQASSKEPVAPVVHDDGLDAETMAASLDPDFTEDDVLGDGHNGDPGENEKDF
jgi:hypothetical protein